MAEALLSRTWIPAATCSGRGARTATSTYSCAALLGHTTRRAGGCPGRAGAMPAAREAPQGPSLKHHLESSSLGAG